MFGTFSQDTQRQSTVQQEDKDAKSSIPVLEDKFKASKNFDFRFTKDQLLDLKRVFDAYDDDFDGVIYIAHLGTVLRAGGLILTEADIVKIRDEFDPEETGLLALPDYFIIMARRMRDMPIIEHAAQMALTKISKAAMIYKEKEDIPVSAIKNILLSKGGDVFSEKEFEEVMYRISQLEDSKTGTIPLRTLQEWIFGRLPPDGLGLRSNPRSFDELAEEKKEQERQARAAKKAMKKEMYEKKKDEKKEKKKEKKRRKKEKKENKEKETETEKRDKEEVEENVLSSDDEDEEIDGVQG